MLRDFVMQYHSAPAIAKAPFSPASMSEPASIPPVIPPDDHPTSLQDDQTHLQDQDQTVIQEPAPTPPVMSIEAWLQKLRRSDRAFYNIMAMEVWSLAKSMDSLLPGFWSRFMENRRVAMQEFVERRRQEGQADEKADGE
jgi:hypothetical protein